MSVTVCVDVILQHKVVLCVADLDGSEQVSRLEARFKDERAVVRTLQLVELLWRQLERLGHLSCPHRLEVTLLAVNVVFVHELLDID